MPGNFLNIDAELPSFTGQESEKDMVQSMMNYMTQLVEQLKYTLMNLDKSNFNQTALDEISTGSAGNIAEQVQTLAAQLNQTNGRVATLSSRMQTAEGEINSIQHELSEHSDSIDALEGAVQVDADTGGITIGGTGTQVDINGDVFINGTPQ
jgi:chromosome segregation ATPase